MPTSTTTATQRVGRLARRHRRTLAACAAGASVLCLGLALRPAAPAVADVVVAARPLPTGHRLAAEDLTRAAVPLGGLPAGTTTDPADLLDRVLAAPLGAGEAVAESRLVVPDGWAAPPGSVPIPVRFGDAGASRLLTAGQRVDVLAADPSADGVDAGDASVARVVAEAVVVLAVVPAEGDGSALVGDAAGTSPLVVLAATRAQALTLAAAQAGDRLSFTLAPP